MLNIKYAYKKVLNIHFSSSIGIPFIYYQCALSAVGWGCCQSPSRCHWLRTVRQKKKKKVAGDICFPEKKKKKEKKKTLILPTSVRDGAGDRPQLSPAALIGWQFVQNPSQTTSLTTHQQILKAYMQPPPSPLRRCRTASKPDAAARRLTFLRTLPPPLPPLLLLLLLLSPGFLCFLIRRDDVYPPLTFIISPVRKSEQTKNFTGIGSRVSFTFIISIFPIISITIICIIRNRIVSK